MLNELMNMMIEELLIFCLIFICKLLVLWPAVRLSPCQPPVVAPSPVIPLVTAGSSLALLLEILCLLQNLLAGMNTSIHTQKGLLLMQYLSDHVKPSFCLNTELSCSTSML